MKKSIAILAGDGIGPEVMAQAVKALRGIEQRFGHQFILREAWVGGAAWERYGGHFPLETQSICEGVDAILFGSVGGPISEQTYEKWKDCERNSILRIRQHFGFQVNMRPIRSYPSLKHPLGWMHVDLLCIRELLGDVYFGDHRLDVIDGIRVASDAMVYDEKSITTAAYAAFDAARGRRKKVTSVDKANVLACSRLWREIATEVSMHYPDVHLEHMLVDNCAMQLIRNPSSFDVLLMPNMFGDILTDEASVLAGSLGMLPSASLNSEGLGLYEPSSGSAPDIAGKGIANPIGQILSVAMMLEYSFGMHEEALIVREAVEKCLEVGYRTPDIASLDDRKRAVTTEELGNQMYKIVMNED